MGHWEHFGEIGEQIVLPKRTKIPLNSNQYCFGSIFINAISVCSGIFVLTHPNLFGILWQWMSIGRTSWSNAKLRTMFAVFGPIPFIDKSSSFVFGTLPLNFSINSFETLFRVNAFLW